MQIIEKPSISKKANILKFLGLTMLYFISPILFIVLLGALIFVSYEVVVFLSPDSAGSLAFMISVFVVISVAWAIGTAAYDIWGRE